ncbi:MAG: GntR family transcriptional regulator [Gammaproteobacteria bacterium]|nr:GntR family transcriptional regulator [Gammaproteobacteria bacterium]MDG2336832.1 GntR family transcriptional regulator [Gammaproteobacteria bacterium]
MSSSNTISHEIAESLRDEILRQQYRSGERFPSERDLAARFDASRGAVREALSQLEQLGLIRTQPGGARVQSVDSASLAVLGPLMQLNDLPNPVLVDQFLETFGVLAALTAKNAINTANAEQLIQLKELVVQLTDESVDLEGMQPRWREFMKTLSEIADNLVVRLISNDLKAQFVDQMMRLGIRPDLKKSSIKRLLSSLRVSINKKDGELASEAMLEHFEELRAAMSEAIGLKASEIRKMVV